MFSKILNKLNPILKKSMTYDNGIEMARHKEITNKTGMKIYFAHSYSSWQRGTNENTNGLIRRHLPKGTGFNLIDNKQLMSIQEKLNNRPRKIIGFKTPNEITKTKYYIITFYLINIHKNIASIKPSCRRYYY